MTKAVILLSGGLDSATTLALARDQGYECYALSVDYGQRHGAELVAAEKVAQSIGVSEHRTVKVDLAGFGGSALTDRSIDVPIEGINVGIPVTYVPARNTIMLSLAIAWAEVLESYNVFIGVNAVDYSGYPDCRPEYVQAFQNLSNLATKVGVESGAMRIHAPIVHLTKAEIIQAGMSLGVDFSKTVSCYQADASGYACGVCESCQLRRSGFEHAQVVDPTRYQKKC